MTVKVCTAFHFLYANACRDLIPDIREKGFRTLVSPAFILRFVREGSGQRLVSSAQEDALVARIVKCAGIFSETVSAVAKCHPKARPHHQSAVPVFLRFGETPNGIDLVRKVREYLALVQIGQLTETFMLYSATEVQELLLQLRLFPRPSCRPVAMPRFLPVSPCVPAEVFQQRGVSGRKRSSLKLNGPFERAGGSFFTRQVAGQVNEQADFFKRFCH